jgi:hypothetical protein
MNLPNARWKFSIDFRMLSILLLIAVVPLLLGTWWLIKSYEQIYIDAQGNILAEEADMGFTLLNNYLGNRIIEVAGLTEVPPLREAVEKGNQDLHKNLDEVRQGLIATEKRWRSLPYNTPELRAILDSPASDFLWQYISVRTSFREIIVTDFLGRTVATTGKAPAYYYANEDWWKEAYSDKKGAVYIGDVSYRESSRSYTFDMAQPFVDRKLGVIGVIMVRIDTQDINALVGSLGSGSRSTATLLQTSGKVISSIGYSTLDRRSFPHATEILESQGKGKRYIISQSEPRSIYGLTAKNFVDTYPHLKWVVTASIPIQNVIASLSSLWLNVLLLVVAVVVIFFLMALWLSRIEFKPIVEDDAHLEKL